MATSACDAPPGFENDKTVGIPPDCVGEMMELVGVPDWKERMESQNADTDFQACVNSIGPEQEQERDVMATEMYKSLSENGVIGQCDSSNFAMGLKAKMEGGLGPANMLGKLNIGVNMNIDKSDQKGCEPVMMMINQISSNTRRMSCTVKRTGTKIEASTEIMNNLKVGNMTNCTSNINQVIDLKEYYTLTVENEVKKEIETETKIAAVLQNAGAAFVKQEGAAAAPAAKQFQTTVQKFKEDNRDNTLVSSVSSAIAKTTLSNKLEIGDTDCTLLAGNYNLPQYVTDTQTTLLYVALGTLGLWLVLYFTNAFEAMVPNHGKKLALGGLLVVVAVAVVAVVTMADTSHLDPDKAIAPAMMNWNQTVVLEKQLDTSFKDELDQSLKTFTTIDSDSTNEASFVGERTQLTVDDVDFSTDPLVQIVMVIAISGAAVGALGALAKYMLAKNKANKPKKNQSQLDRAEAARIVGQGAKDQKALEQAQGTEKARQLKKLDQQLSDKQQAKKILAQGAKDKVNLEAAQATERARQLARLDPKQKRTNNNF
jgi:hypothetical protein